MNKNYQKELDQILEGICGSPPKLLLHSCCAPCSSYVLEYLSNFFSITVLFYNPNMDSEEEFVRRAEEQLRLIEQLPAKYHIEGVIVPYDAQEFYQCVKGMEQEPEGGKRCEYCFELRLDKAAQYAVMHQYDYFTTTLTISPLKNASLLNEIGQKVGERYQIPFLPSDFKKRGGFLRSTQLSEQYQLYRQAYCGCIYSKQERMKKEENKKF